MKFLAVFGLISLLGYAVFISALVWVNIVKAIRDAKQNRRFGKIADPTVSYIFGTLTEKQKQYVYEKAGLVMKDSSCLNGIVNSIKRHPNYTDIQKAVIIWILENVAEKKKTNG